MMFELTWKMLKSMIGEPVMIRIKDNYDFKKWVFILERSDDLFGKAYACIDSHGMQFKLRKLAMKEGIIHVYDRFSQVDAEVQGEEDND